MEHAQRVAAKGFVHGLQFCERELVQRFAGLFRQIQQDGSGLEYRDRLTAVCRLMIDYGRNLVVRRDPQEPGFELFALRETHRDASIRHACFLEEQKDLLAVRCC